MNTSPEHLAYDVIVFPDDEVDLESHNLDKAAETLQEVVASYEAVKTKSRVSAIVRERRTRAAVNEIVTAEFLSTFGIAVSEPVGNA